MPILEFFPQGGLGNQMIQHAYVAALSNETGCDVVVNPVLLTKAWASFRRISWRQPSHFLFGYHHLLDRSVSKIVGLTRLQLSLLRHQCLTDDFDHSSILSSIACCHTQQRLQMYGYFQRHHAFSADNQPFWSFIANRFLGANKVRDPYPFGQIAVHIRLGDYRRPENLNLFVQPPLEQLLKVALEWRSQYGVNYPVHIITDDPHTLARELHPNLREEISLLGGNNAYEDFALLARHRHLVISNSTFSLCAGRLSSELWGSLTTVAHLGRWFVDDRLDVKHQLELDQCDFCTTFDKLFS